MFILGLAMVGLGYAIAYYGAVVLVTAYTGTATMNPPPFTLLLGVPGAGQVAGKTGAAQQGQGGIPTLPAALSGGAGA